VLFRAGMVWLGLLVIAIAAAGFRTSMLLPRLGEQAAHVVGTLLVVAIFAQVIWLVIPWVVPGLDRSGLFLVAAGWTVATIAFEFLFGHYVGGHPWHRLFADYDLSAGRLWLLVLLTVLFVPMLRGRAG